MKPKDKRPNVRVKTQVPLLNGGMKQLATWLKQHSVFKPGNRLGGGWMGDQVARRGPIHLCPTCVRKYGDWYKTVNYRPNWDYSPAYGKPGWNCDCDGCGGILNEGCTGFYAEEVALQSLDPKFHFQKPNPHRRLFFSRF